MYLLVQRCPAPGFKKVYPIEFYSSQRMASLRQKQMNCEYQGTSKFEVWDVEVKGICQENHS